MVAITDRIRKGTHALISSEAIDREVDACPDAEKAELVRQILRLARERVTVTGKELERWQELMGLGFRQIDALHLACAESAHCDLFLTTDDKLLARGKSRAAFLRVAVANPLAFILEDKP